MLGGDPGHTQGAVHCHFNGCFQDAKSCTVLAPLLSFPQFLESVLETNLQEADEASSLEEKASMSPEHAGGKRDVSMAELMNDHNLDISFNYGGSSISAAEMSVSDHYDGRCEQETCVCPVHC